MRTLFRFALALLFLAALPLAAQTGTWTAIPSTGAIDESSLGAYSMNGPNLSHVAGSLTPIVARYNVTNTYGGGDDDTPPWTRLELGYFDNSVGGQVRATLYRVDPCTGNQIAICTVVSADNPGSTCLPCSITAGIDFSQFLYYVEVLVTRNAAGVTPIARTLRIY